MLYPFLYRWQRHVVAVGLGEIFFISHHCFIHFSLKLDVDIAGNALCREASFNTRARLAEVAHCRRLLASSDKTLNLIVEALD